MDIINNINHAYNTKMKNIYNLLKIKDDTFQIEYEKYGEKKYVTIMDKHKKLITCSYRLFGIYQQHTQFFIWASSTSNIDQNTIKRIRRLKRFNYLFKSNTDPKAQFYYQLLTQDIIYIDNYTKIEWINHLLLYLTDGIYFINPINNTNIQFILLKKIKQQYI